MFKNKLSKYLILGGMGTVGLIIGVAGIAGAQVATTSTTPTAASLGSTTVVNQTVDTPEAGDVADTKEHGHAPLGGDGIIASINGTNISVSEESDEGGATYTVDVRHATFTNNGAAATIADFKVGQKISVQGSTSGNLVTATSISLGHSGKHMDKAEDTDGGTAAEANEPADSSDASDQ